MIRTKELCEFSGYYVGRLNNKQLYGSFHHGKKYAIIEYNSMNSYQNFLYNRALFGLSVYSKEDIKRMRWDKRKRIIKVHERAQEILNLWKQELGNLRVKEFFVTLFPKSNVTSQLLEDWNYVDPEITCKTSFKDLGITRDMVINKLINAGVLPKDFYQLNPVELVEETQIV